MPSLLRVHLLAFVLLCVVGYAAAQTATASTGVTTGSTGTTGSDPCAGYNATNITCCLPTSCDICDCDMCVTAGGTVVGAYPETNCTNNCTYSATTGATTGGASSSSAATGLSPGVIAAIVLGSVAGAGLIMVIVVYFTQRTVIIRAPNGRARMGPGNEVFRVSKLDTVGEIRSQARMRFGEEVHLLDPQSGMPLADHVSMSDVQGSNFATAPAPAATVSQWQGNYQNAQKFF